MEREAVYKIGIDLTYLASCSLRGITPDRSRLEAMNLFDVHKMANLHLMQSISYLAVAKAHEKYPDLAMDEELLNTWKAEHHRAVRKLVTLDLEREKLYEFLRANKIWYMGLKGIQIQRYYPSLGMRQMADNDILINSQGAKNVRDYFIGEGYEVVSYGKSNHDIYRKGAAVFEIHRELVANRNNLKLGHKYYSNVKKRLLPLDGQHEFAFSNDDYYVFYIFHSYKHFSSGGCGIRTLMDIALLNSKQGEGVNRDYLVREMKKLGVDEYESMSRALAEKIFFCDPDELYSDDFMDRDMEELFLYYISSGTFGTFKNLIENQLKNLAQGKELSGWIKAKYLLKRVFPSMDFYKTCYPRASKWIVTIPFLWFARLVRGLFKARKFRSEIEYIKNKK